MPDLEVIELLPENLREKPLWDGIAKSLQHEYDEFHLKNVRPIENAFDLESEFVEIQKLVDFLTTKAISGTNIIPDETAFVYLIANYYQLKGTKRGLSFVMNLLGFGLEVIHWFEANLDLVGNALASPLDPCEVILVIDIGDNALTQETVDFMVQLLKALNWICVEFILHFCKRFREFPNPQQDFLIDLVSCFEQRFICHCPPTSDYPFPCRIYSPLGAGQIDGFDYVGAQKYNDPEDFKYDDPEEVVYGQSPDTFLYGWGILRSELAAWRKYLKDNPFARCTEFPTTPGPFQFFVQDIDSHHDEPVTDAVVYGQFSYDLLNPILYAGLNVKIDILSILVEEFVGATKVNEFTVTIQKN